jgi:subtilase family serine protease
MRTRLPAAMAALILAGTLAATNAPGASGSTSWHRACGGAVARGEARCFALWSSTQTDATRATASATTPPKHAYTPADMTDVYQLDTSLGAGQTIAIVDAYDDPHVEADLALYRKTWGLPPCTTANKCFRKVNQRGGTTPPHGDPGWGVEISLDVQAVSAVCPNCSILLVEADSPAFTDLGLAVNTAVRLGADVVSNSYGGDEYGGSARLGTKFYTHPGVAQVVASGDFGFGPAEFPASWPAAIAVGGTSLTRTTTGWDENAWWGSGSGCSAWFDKPAWQQDANCPMRTVADLSAFADPEPGFAVYDTYGLGRHSGWIAVGGTSVSAPLIAGMVGLAGNAASLGSAKYIYKHRSGLADVVGGSNGYCGGDYLCQGKVGYDAPTGWGSPRGLSAL